MSGPRVVRTLRVINWNDFRTNVERLVLQGNEISFAVSQHLTCQVELSLLFNTQYLILRAARRRAQRVARCKEAPIDWITCPKVNAAFRRHTLRWRRRQWHQFWESLDFRLPSPRMWHLAHFLMPPTGIRQAVASSAISTDMSLLETIASRADQFSPPPPRLENVQPHRTEPSAVLHMLSDDEDFTLVELEHFLNALRRRGATEFL